MTRAIVTTSATFGRFSDAPVEQLRSAGYEVRFVERNDRAGLLVALADAEAWIVGFEPVNAETLAAAPDVRVVAKCGVGLDNFDFEYLRSRHIDWLNVPGGNSGAVAEYAIGQLLALTRGVAVNDRLVRGGAWRPIVGRGLDGLTLGIVGFGNIGTRVGVLARAFGMRILITDPIVNETALAAVDGRAVALHKLLAGADAVTLHVPLAGDTWHLIGAAEFAAMRPSTFLVNTARGGVVDEAALVSALRDGRIAGAALDVTEAEPLPADSPLRGAPNLLLSPHTAGYSDTALATVTMSCAESLLAALADASEPVR